VQAARVTGADVTRYAELRLAEKAAVAARSPREQTRRLERAQGR